jgi:2-oxo-3-hexenedioate decarboxylase
MNDQARGAKLGEPTLRLIAAEVFDAFMVDGKPVQPFSARYPAFTTDDAYEVSALVHGMRLARGFKPVGRKIGFTNRTIWHEYNVFAPNWGYVYDRTLHDLAAPLPLSPYSEPKIEPEIVFGLRDAPSPGMDDATLLTCIDWVAHGFEIVQSIFPGWKFSPADTTAANAMHAALLIGDRKAVRGREEEWLRTLSGFEVALCRDSQLLERGKATNVMEGPLSTLRHMMSLLARDPYNAPLAAGEIVSTGTLTRALHCHAGESWTTTLSGIALNGIGLRFA